MVFWTYNRESVKEKANAGCQFLQTGSATPILKHQASEGFAHVEEQTLVEIHDKVLKRPKPTADDGNCRKDVLALSLMKALLPAMTHPEAVKPLNKAYHLENPDSTVDPKVIPKQCLMELVNPREASEIHQTFERARKIKKNAEATTKQRRESVEKFFKAPPKKASAGSEKKAPHWKAPRNPEVPAATKYVESMLPYSVTVEEDQYNGRWRLLCESDEWKSVSWMRRGLQHATDLALFHAWTLHTAHTAEEPPFDVEELHCA